MDTQITNFLNGLVPHNQFFSLFFSFFSLKASSLPIWFVIIIFLIVFEEKINKKFIVYFFISIAVTAVVVFGLKNIIRRPRPPNLTYEVRVADCGKDFSFPSGHASIAFASATILAAFDKKRKWFYYLVAALIGLSRIYLQCHYFLDVLTGVAIGCAISKLTVYITIPNEIFFRKRH